MTVDDGCQQLEFVEGEDEGITDVRIGRPGAARTVEVGGVRFHLEATT